MTSRQIGLGKRWTGWIGLTALTGLAVFMAGAAVLGLLARGALAHSTRWISIPKPPAVAATGYVLSEDQAALLRARGNPQAFTLLFYEETGDDGQAAPVRAETWSYYRDGVEIDFLNGVSQREREIQVQEGVVLPVPYTPDQFTGFMTLEETLAAAHVGRVLAVPLEADLVRGGQVYYADEITFGLVDDALRYVQVLALVTQE